MAKVMELYLLSGGNLDTHFLYMKIKFTNTISKKTIDPNQFLVIFFLNKCIILDLCHKHHIFWLKNKRITV